MAVKLGLDCKLYYSTGTRATWGTATNGVHGGAAPSLTEITVVKDVTLSLETNEADVTTRGSGGWKQSAATLKEAKLEFEMPYVPTDAGFLALRTAWLTNTPIAFAVLDGDKAVSGSQGLWADFSILSFSRDEKLDDAARIKVTAAPALTTVGPEWVAVS